MYNQIDISKRNQLVGIYEAIKILKNYKQKSRAKETITHVIYSLRDIVQERYYHSAPTKRKNYKKLSITQISDILYSELQSIEDKTEKNNLSTAYYYIELLRLYFEGNEKIYNTIAELESKLDIHIYVHENNIELDELY